MIHEEICTYEVAKLAKEKGFNWICLHYFRTKNKDLFRVFPCEDWSNIEDRINAPTQSLLQRWLREEKGIVIDVVLDWEYNVSIDIEKILYQYRIGSIDEMTIEGGIKTKGLVFDKRFTTYELALSDALKYALENLV